jgi:radical SAM superfamily enzyme YgiQ (UPF0313 family)
MPPLGLAHLASFLIAKGYKDIKIIDNSVLGLGLNDLVSYIRSLKPDLVGITTTTQNRFPAYELAKALKQRLNNSFVVLGGVHASFCADEILKKIKEVDFIVRGEGEKTFLELIKALEENKSLFSIKGLSFKNNSQIIHNPERELIEDLDSLPLPSRELLPMDAYNQKLPLTDIPATTILTARGCPYACVFCSSATFWRRRVRFRSPSNIINEIKLLIKNYKIEGLQIHDDTFTLDKNRVLELCKQLKELRLKFWAEARANTLDEEIVLALKSAGCYMLTLGVESGSDYILKKIKKGITQEEVRRAVSLCKKHNIMVKTFFMASLPGENYYHLKKTQEFIFELRTKYKVKESILSLALIYPGTELEEIANKQYNFKFSWVDDYKPTIVYKKPLLANPQMPLFENPNFTYEDIYKAIRKIKSTIYIKHPLWFLRRCIAYPHTLIAWIKSLF